MVEFAPSALFKSQYRDLDGATRDLVITLCQRVANWIYKKWDHGCRIDAMVLTVPVKDNIFMAFSYREDGDVLIASKFQYD